jgi:DNA-directed RNA polymerase subunit RPC12/RpoP
MRSVARVSLVVDCPKCGGPVPVPDDMRTPHVRCPYCTSTVAVPGQPGGAPEASPDAWVGPVIGVLLGFMVVAAIVVGLWLWLEDTAPPAEPAVPPSRAPPVELSVSVEKVTPPVEPPDELPTAEELRTLSGAVRMTELMKERRADHCPSVLLPPTLAEGERNLTNMIENVERCVELLAVTAAQGNLLTVTMESPIGEPIAGPEPATEVRFRYCPRERGPHRVRVSAATMMPFTVAGIECRLSAEERRARTKR